jgi:hypothetical protein
LKLTDLIDLLDGQLEEHGDIEVLIASQPSYPLAHSLGAVTALPFSAGSTEPALWLAAGDHPTDRSPYAPTEAWEGESAWQDALEAACRDEIPAGVDICEACCEPCHASETNDDDLCPSCAKDHAEMRAASQKGGQA